MYLAEAARPKDGASAGVTLAVALVSAVTGRPMRSGVAMSGELTLSGRVAPVAGIREKVIEAGRAGMTAVILPADNEPDVAESFGEGLPCGLSVRYAATMDDMAHRGAARRSRRSRAGRSRADDQPDMTIAHPVAGSSGAPPGARAHRDKRRGTLARYRDPLDGLPARECGP